MKHLSKYAAIVSTIALFGAGCATSAPPPDGTSPATPVAPVATPSRGGCENPYYPMRPGSSIAYRITGAGTSSEYEAKFLEASGSDHRVQYVFSVDGNDVTLDQSFTCDNGVLKANGYADFSSVLGGQFSYDTESVDGVFLPANLAVGSEWQTTYRTVVHTDNPQLKAMVDGKRQTLRMQNKIVGSERVTVPSGTYEALKMESQVSVESEVGMNLSFTNTSWLVKDVGLVKAASGVEGSTSVTEAISVR